MDKWAVIRAEYEAGHGSIRDLAGKYGISKTTVAEHAKAEGWTKGEKKPKKADKSGQKRTKKADKKSEVQEHRPRPRGRDPCGDDGTDWDAIKVAYLNG